jgi:hypothetical protein
MYRENHPEYANAINSIPILYRNIGKYAQTETLYLQSAAIAKQILAENHPDYAGSLHNPANLYANIRKYAKAGSLYQLEFKAGIEILRNNFSILTESEKKNFLKLNNQGFKSYYPFSKRYNTTPTIQKVYDNVLFLKGLLLVSGQQIREKILGSTDSSLKAAFTDWTIQKNKIIK